MMELLLLKYINHTASLEERTQVEHWLIEDEANRKTCEQFARIYHAYRTKDRILHRNAEDALYKVHQRIAGKIRRINIWRLTVAASFFIGILGIGSMLYKNRQVDVPVSTVTTNPGMRSQLTLSDGTIVHLNAGSTLIYPLLFDKKERCVQLSGEAYFQVAGNAGQPFSVSVAGTKLNIQVTGTAFNCQAYEKDSLAQVTLIEGSVDLRIQGQNGNIHLSPSEMITYNMLTDQVFLRKTNTLQVTAWMDGQFIFKDTPMTEVLRKLSHFYSVDFDIKDEVIRGYRFTGTFENRPLFQILDYIKISSKIDHEMLYPENQEIRKPLILLKKEKTKR